LRHHQPVTRGRVDLKVVTDRTSAIRRMVAPLRALPCARIEEFTSDFRTPAAAESLLRRTIEALMDIEASAREGARYRYARVSGNRARRIGARPRHRCCAVQPVRRDRRIPEPPHPFLQRGHAR